MSVKTETQNYSREELKKIDNDLDLVIRSTSKFGGQAKLVAVYALSPDEKYLYIPFYYGVSTLGLPLPDRTPESTMSRCVSFTGKLRPEQDVVKKEVVDLLNKRGCAVLSAATGQGKTALAIKIASMIKLKTLVINNRVQVLKQWKDSIEKFCPSAKIKMLNTKSVLDKDADFYIMNATNVPKMGLEFFSTSKFCIVDEGHLILAETLSKALQYVCPRYLLALTATPYRPDGFNVLMDMYFGPEKVIRKLQREHIVYKVETRFKPTLETTETGKLNWGVVLNSLAENEERNKLICDLVCSEKERCILLLCKRVKQAKILKEALLSRGESVTSLIGSEQIFDREARILVGMEQKCGTGFDHDRLDCLFLVSSIDNGEKSSKNPKRKGASTEPEVVKEKFFIQILGRVFRRQDTVPLIYDFVDNFGVLQKHFKSREEVYLEVGGKVIDWKNSLLKK